MPQNVQPSLKIQPNPSKIKEFIRSQKRIVFTADSTPGFGNQAATASVIARFKEWGYQGAIDLIYPHSMVSKITTIFDLPANISQVYYDPHSNINFLTMAEQAKRHLNKSVSMATLGITGANDYGFCTPAEQEGIDLSTLSPLDCDNDANFNDVKVFVDLSAFYTAQNIIYPYNLTIEKDTPFQEHSNNKFLLAPVATLADAKRYLVEDPRGQSLLESRPAIKAYLEGLESYKFNVMPAYGYTIQDYYQKNFPWNILQFICGATFATSGNNIPLVIPVFYDYKHEASILYDLIHNANWSILDKSWRARDAIHDYLIDLRLPENFLIADATDKNAVEQIQNLNGDNVLLLSLGPLPKVVFEGLYTYSATNVLPQIYEGENTFYSLVKNEKPFLRCSPYWEIQTDLTNNTVFNSWFNTFYHEICNGAQSWIEPANGDIVKKIAMYIHDSQVSNSDLSTYFLALNKYAALPENDRIEVGLQGAMDLLESEKVKTTSFSTLSVAAPLQTSSANQVGPTFNPVYDLIISPALKLKNLFAPYLGYVVKIASEAAKSPEVQQSVVRGLLTYGLFNFAEKNVFPHLQESDTNTARLVGNF